MDSSRAVASCIHMRRILILLEGFNLKASSLLREFQRAIFMCDHSRSFVCAASWIFDKIKHRGIKPPKFLYVRKATYVSLVITDNRTVCNSVS